MNLERVGRPKITFLQGPHAETMSGADLIGEISSGVGLLTVVAEIITNQNAGLLVNAELGIVILFGAVIGNLPGYKEKQINSTIRKFRKKELSTDPLDRYPMGIYSLFNDFIHGRGEFAKK
jgi:hypothetical protein